MGISSAKRATRFAKGKLGHRNGELGSDDDEADCFCLEEDNDVLLGWAGWGDLSGNRCWESGGAPLLITVNGEEERAVVVVAAALGTRRRSGGGGATRRTADCG